MWRLKPLSSSIQLSSALPSKCQIPQSPILNKLRGTSLSPKQLVCHLWSGTKIYQAGLPEANLKIDSSFREGQEIEGFTVTEVGHIPEYHLTAIQLIHKDTGAKYLHVDRKDTNNVFSINLRTTPMDSTGLPHILEHTTLCGSEKFPVRDPFFKMLVRSLATFMNAMTGPDYTIYPFATQNKQDYFNLMSVYLDAVFRPKLSELDFKQEGWRLEHEDVNDRSSPIVLKGVVFNEMKGVLSDNSNIFMERFMNSILPSHTYAVNSGGDPLVIPNLTHDDLVKFHRNYYRPENARLYSYGTFPLQDNLKFLSSYLVKHQEAGVTDTSVPLEPRWSSERREHYSYRPDALAADPQKQSSLAVGWLTADIKNVQENFELEIITELLVKGPNSPFYKTLVEPNIGAGLHPITGFTSQTRDTIFAVGLQGMDSTDFDRVVNIIDNTLADVVKNGFEKERVEEVLHSIELSMRHQSSNFGLSVLFGLAPLWNHDVNIFDALRQADQISKLRSNLKKSPSYLQDKVKEYLVDNSHRLILSMSPDNDYVEKLSKTEGEILANKVKSLSDDEKELIYKQGLLLKATQEKKDDLSLLPTLHISDVKDDVERHTLQLINFKNVPIQFAAQPTNGITYFRAVLNTSHLTEEEKNLFSVFCSVAAKMGTKDHDFHEFDHLVQMKTGGLSVGVQSVNHTSDMFAYEEGLMLGSYCLERNFGAMLDLWGKLLNSVTFQNKGRLETLVNDMASDLVNGLIHSGHRYAMLSAGSQISPLAQYQEVAGGVTHINIMKKLAGSDVEPLLSQMVQIAQKTFVKDNLRVAVNCMPEILKETESKLTSFLESLPGCANSQPKIWTKKEATNVTNEPGIHHVLPFSVNFAAKSVLTVPYIHPDHAVLQVLSKLLSSKYLHPNIREKGGAYGSGVGVNQSGLLNFFSYRDPNTSATFDIFDNSYSWVVKNEFTDKEIDESKLGIFQSLDAPVAPGSRGNLAFVNHVSYDMFQNYRLQVKNVSRDSILEVASKYLNPESKSITARTLIGPENKDVISRSGEFWKTISY
ncbi:hypothetical protein FOCC_FOCC000738 [Frankliniella occidentalis]|uniref:Presequence protease, mitochondrial n=1 Tax=Frankliniella occidentalis TaxID=133901 RepID=A0A6J1S2A2_FRAOC|nr:presequence protease, mitochondrial [Frankliniella occidentalis]XP_026275138.1 presequence protease, mitochondrial [Frankliniella occidentalis]KAE8752616.1 hypothetical protein FOCC_FOCC000738 [Frankliniella occidentalis]